MRKVMVSKYVKHPDNKLHLEEVGVAAFHQFGVDYEEFENGPANFTVAIIEWPDGKVESIAVECIKFLAEPDQ